MIEFFSISFFSFRKKFLKNWSLFSGYAEAQDVSRYSRRFEEGLEDASRNDCPRERQNCPRLFVGLQVLHAV